MKDRIKKIRKELNLTQQGFAERIGIKRNTIANYETGRNDPIDSVISLICREFGVREEWLRTGEGEMFRATPSDVLDQLAYQYQLSNADYILIEKFVHLRPEVRKAIFDYIHEVDSAFQDDKSNPHELAYSGNEKPFPMDDIINRIQERNAEPTTEELEDLYKKNILNSARRTDATASNTTEGTGENGTKVSNQ